MLTVKNTWAPHKVKQGKKSPFFPKGYSKLPLASKLLVTADIRERPVISDIRERLLITYQDMLGR